jgi:hypothetical protein
LPSAELDPNLAQKSILELDFKVEEGVRSKLILCFTVKTWQGPTEVFVEGRKSQTLKDLDTQQSVGLLIRANKFTAH